MDITIRPGRLSGNVSAIPSKSQAHRMLICAAFADSPTTLLCPETNRDIQATADCLNALGAEILRTEEGYVITPVKSLPAAASLPCGESGSTLRFLLPVCGALGVDTTFVLEGRLPQRPMSPLWERMEEMGCRLSRPTENTIRCEGKLQSGVYEIAGNVSSQFITGLLLAAPLMGGAEIRVAGKLESRPYVEMTRMAMKLFGVESDNLTVGPGSYRSPGKLLVEGDWSGGAFFLTAQALGSRLTVSNLDMNSPQGDRAVVEILKALTEKAIVPAGDIPDLVPILSVYAACNQGAVFTDIGRLRLKESDRVESTIAMLKALGGDAHADENTLTVLGGGLTGGTVDAVNDHRIAMSAAIAATVCTHPVTILGAQCAAKSYPQFWAEYARLGGQYEQYIR